MIAAIYIRVSTEEQAQTGYSLAEQREACRKRAKELNADEIIEFADEGYSGALLERPGLSALREAVRQGRIGMVICRDPDRLARKLSYQLLLTEEFEKKGVRLEFVDFTWQNSPEGKLFYSIKGAVSEFEKDKIRERLTRGRLQKAKEKKLPISPRAYGYVYDPDTGTVSVDPEESKIVLNIFKWFVREDVGAAGIAKRLNAMGIPSKKGGLWHKQVVSRILRNEIYIGKYWYNRHDTSGILYNKAKPKGEKVRPRPRPVKDWIAIPVPAIVPEELFRQAQDKLGNVRRLYAGRKPDYPYLLTGIIRCGDCGLPMHGSTRSIWGQYMPCYTCAQPGPARTGCRPVKYVRAEHLEAAVWDLVKKWVSDPEALAEEIANSIPHKGDIEEEMFRLKKELASLEKGYSNLIAAMAQGVLDLTAEVKNSLAANKERKLVIEKRLRELEKLISSNAVETTVKKLIGLAQAVLRNIDKLSSEDKRAIVRTLIDEIKVAGRGKDIAVTITSSLSPYQIQLKRERPKITEM